MVPVTEEMPDEFAPPACSFCKEAPGPASEDAPVVAIMTTDDKAHSICLACAMGFLEELSAAVRAAEAKAKRPEGTALN